MENEKLPKVIKRKRVKKYTENRVVKIVANFFNYNFVIIVFFMGANELTMLAFY